MSTLNKLAIRGIRSFDDKNISVIEFFSPVTVIIGANGSGKTTIIESLKYATTGDQPPGTRGGAFVHDPKMANEKEVKAQVKLRFIAANGQRMLAVRNLSVTMKKNAGMTMKTLESILALADGNPSATGKRGVISTKCAEMDTEIPHLMGVSKAVLENVIFCHQEDSYWPLAEPGALKKKFDDIFEATRYTKALDSIKALRKDRVAELKAEKERLESLSVQKAHADKLRGRMSDLNASLVAKETEFQDTRRLYDELVRSNQHFYESATKFRETYMRIQALEEKKARDQTDMKELQDTTKELEDSEETLHERARNFNEHMEKQRQLKGKEIRKEQDVADELQAARRTHVSLNEEHGQLVAEAKAQETRISDREALVREIAGQFDVRGFDVSPLENAQVSEFTTRLLQLQRKQVAERDAIQKESRTKGDEYMAQSQRLHRELESFSAQRKHGRDRIAKLQSEISAGERMLETSEMLDTDIENHVTEMEEQSARIETTRAKIAAANYDERIADLNDKIRQLEDSRNAYTSEIRSLSLQSEARANLALQQKELATKTRDMKNMLQISSTKFAKLVGSNPEPETMERELDALTNAKEKRLVELESELANADRALHEAETRLTSLRTQREVKLNEIQASDRKINEELSGEYDSIATAVATANDEIQQLRDDLATRAGAHQLYVNFLKIGRSKHLCTGCNRHLEDGEIQDFENYLQEKIARTAPEGAAKASEDLDDWEKALEGYQRLVPLENSRTRLQETEVPGLDRQIKEQEAALPALADFAEKARGSLKALQGELKDIASIRQHAVNVSRLHGDAERIKKEITDIESSLASTGSTRTADDLQNQLDDVSKDLRACESQKQTLATERERRNNLLRQRETEHHKLQLRESDLRSQLKEKDALKQNIEGKRTEISSLDTEIKGLDVKVLEGQAPIDTLEREYKSVREELNVKLEQAQNAAEALNISADKLENASRAIDRYVHEKRGRKLKECGEAIKEYEAKIHDLNKQLEQVRGAITQLEKEIGQSVSAAATLRENLKIRKLARDIVATQQEIESHDMEEAARAKRNFEEKYPIEKQKENDMQARNASVGGEIKTVKSQVKVLEGDLAEYKNINKKYTEQLVRVKMSDMANNDLEKYGKALDNAIMKYHSLKMGEVNDSMRHLWNKTYQGTDIDGIKILSDSDGGASKRSYNYRVVMTKDQVEMDMRGRCSAGQKMLASIIIRLALSDSFGQNCGILALDEPTNALDTENIDALAASLIDIIHERKNHANFQLIIITHDENFLRKLGQSDVMEYYWRVSRDSRQKSVIERQRFA
ncbi:hypothetical protein FA95DRAFT_1555700 [Auriscalpium vulgare]|uniref:Uncharacterized protein n=1 Tax=Auriscalpium vulgare TaxID=40419 RepID=A0ACB8S2L4_9AGAM|nr:hypothetical protein FA95DRAFT_1555700 [Auriscalpium vulgare]